MTPFLAHITSTDIGVVAAAFVAGLVGGGWLVARWLGRRDPR